METCFKCKKALGIFAEKRYDTNARLLCGTCWNKLPFAERDKSFGRSYELRKTYLKKEKLKKIEKTKERGFWKTTFDLTWKLFFFLIGFDFFISIMENKESTFQRIVNQAGPSAGAVLYLIEFIIASILLSLLFNTFRFSWWKIKDRFKK